MAGIIRAFVNLLLMLLAVIFLHGVALGDIAPPLPTVPLTNVTVPEPIVVILAGLLMTGALWWGASIASRDGAPGRASLARGVAGVILGLTVLLTAYSWAEHSSYAVRRSRWRSPGPVREFQQPESQETMSQNSEGPENGSRSTSQN